MQHPFNAKPHFSSEADIYRCRAYIEAYTLLQARMPGYAKLLAGAPVIVTSKLPTAATDGIYIYVNLDYFNSLPSTGHRAALLGHEVGHVALRHGIRGLHYQTRGHGPDGKPFDHYTYNVAGDRVINQDLKAAKLPILESWIQGEAGDRDRIVDHIYCDLRAQAAQQPQPPQQQQPEPQDPSEGDDDGDDTEDSQGEAGADDAASDQPMDADTDESGDDTDTEGAGDDAGDGEADADDGEDISDGSADSSSPSPDSADEPAPSPPAQPTPENTAGHDTHLEPQYDGTPTEQAEQAQEDAERIEREVDAANKLQESEAAEHPDRIKRPSEPMKQAGRLESIAAKVDWRTELADLMTRAGKGGDSTFARINSRKYAITGVIAPTQRGRFGHLALTVDVSGSVSDTMYNKFLQELAPLVDTLQPEQITVLMCSTRVHRVVEPTCGAELLDCQRTDNGGTRMGAGVEWLEANGIDPDLHLIFTDGEMSERDWKQVHDSGARVVLDSVPWGYYAAGYKAVGHQPIIMGEA